MNNTSPLHNKQNKTSAVRSSWKLISVVVFLLGMLAILPYGYAYYQKTQISKDSQFSVQKQLERLVKAPDVIEYDWMRTLNPKAKAIEGGVVWSKEQQTGIMRFKNLPAIDEQQSYHLTLHDRNIDQPISSVRFRQDNYDPDERLVAFRPETKVDSLYKFILTLENPDKDSDEVLLRIQP